MEQGGLICEEPPVDMEGSSEQPFPIRPQETPFLQTCGCLKLKGAFCALITQWTITRAAPTLAYTKWPSTLKLHPQTHALELELTVNTIYPGKH